MKKDALVKVIIAATNRAQNRIKKAEDAHLAYLLGKRVAGRFIWNDSLLAEFTGTVVQSFMHENVRPAIGITAADVQPYVQVTIETSTDESLLAVGQNHIVMNDRDFDILPAKSAKRKS